MSSASAKSASAPSMPPAKNFGQPRWCCAMTIPSISAAEMLGIVIAQHHRGWPKFFAGGIDGAEADFAEALDMSMAMRHDEGVAYGLEGLAAIRAAQHDAEQTG